MKKIVPPPPLLHQNHFSSTSVKTKRRKSSFLLRRKNFNLISSTSLMLGHHKLRMTMLLLLCTLNTLTVTLAKEALQGDEKHPLVIFAESQDPDTKSLLLEEQQREKREGRQYEYNDQNNPQRSSSNSRQKSPQDLVSDIHCIRTSNREEFKAFIQIPKNFQTIPALEDVGGNSDPGYCTMSRTNVDGIIALDISSFERCGVRSCQPSDGSAADGSWMCVAIRFPILPGLKMPEDEVLEIKCKPQDHAIAGSNVINFQEKAVEQRSPTIYVGGGQEFLSEIGLFRRLPGTELFATRVKSGSTIELGENVELRSIVRKGDGWNFSKLTEVVVHRIHNGKALDGESDTAKIVLPNGCRNPSYRALAERNPSRDIANPLINNFDFRVFMFQSMSSGDSIMITAKVIACVEEMDCAPARCDKDQDPGYGRKKRSVFTNSSILLSSTHHIGKTKDWEENLKLKIRMPSDLRMYDDGVRDAAITITPSECKIYLILTLAVALTFLILSAIIVLVACIKRYQESKANLRRRKQEAEEREQMARTEVKSVSQQMNMQADTENKLNGHAVFFSSGMQPGEQRSLNILQSNGNNGHISTSQTPRPVTVRSVKRRDKAKTEEKKFVAANYAFNNASSTFHDKKTSGAISPPKNGDEHAVMV